MLTDAWLVSKNANLRLVGAPYYEVRSIFSLLGGKGVNKMFYLYICNQGAIIYDTRLITLMSKPIVLFLFYFSLWLFVGLGW